MLASALIFLLGVLVAALAALLFAPILWRKAQGFARREFEATMPATANEIRAEFDAVRASAAVEMRRQEVETAEMRERMNLSRSELGRANVEIATLRKRTKDMEADMAAFASERDNFREIFAAHRDKERALAETLDEAKRDGSLNAEELEALAVKFRDTSELAEGRQIELVAAQTKIERLSDTLRSVERASGEKDTLIRLLRREAERGGEEKPARAKSGLMPGMQVRPTTAAGAPAPDPLPPVDTLVPSQNAAPAGSLRDDLMPLGADGTLTDAEAAKVRERIAAVAASVIYRTAVAEGESSSLAPLLRPVSGGGTEASDAENPPSLATRVRRIAASEAQAAASADPEDVSPRAE